MSETNFILSDEQIADMNRAAQDQGISGIPPALHLARAVESAVRAALAAQPAAEPIGYVEHSPAGTYFSIEYIGGKGEDQWPAHGTLLYAAAPAAPAQAQPLTDERVAEVMAATYIDPTGMNLQSRTNAWLKALCNGMQQACAKAWGIQLSGPAGATGAAQ